MDITSIQPYIDIFANNPNWFGLLVFFISLLESLVLIGMFVPGMPVMFSVGVLMGNGTVPLMQTMILAILGAIAGDSISFAVGKKYHMQLKRMWPFNLFPKLFERGEVFFQKYGGYSIIIGRFGPARPIVPAIAGMMDMNQRKFLIFNILSAIIWAPAYTMPGILIGASINSVGPEALSKLSVVLITVAVAIWLLYLLVTNILDWLGEIVYAIAKKLSLNNKPSQIVFLLFFALVFFYLFIDVIIDVKKVQGVALLNENIYHILRAGHSSDLIDFFTYATGLAETWVILPAVALAGIVLAFQGRFITSVWWVLSIAIPTGVGYLIKHSLPNKRPDGITYYSVQNSLPSGHMLTSTLISFVLAYLACKRFPERKNLIWLAAILFSLFIGFSRLYLGVHWFTDILASFFFSVGSFLVAIAVYKMFEKYIKNLTKQSTATFFSVMLIGWLVYCNFYYPIIRPGLERAWVTTSFNSETWWDGDIDVERLLIRQGAFKRQASLIDIEIIAELDSVVNELISNGWETLPEFSLLDALNIFNKDVSFEKMPAMPLFHKDRLPVIVLSKKIDESKRLLLQLWNSDLVTTQGYEINSFNTYKPQQMLIGNLRLEHATYPLNWFLVFRELPLTSPDNKVLLNELQETLDKKFETKLIDLPDPFNKDETVPVLLIK